MFLHVIFHYSRPWSVMLFRREIQILVEIVFATMNFKNIKDDVTFFEKTLSIGFPILFSQPRKWGQYKVDHYAPSGNSKIVQEDHPILPRLPLFVGVGSANPLYLLGSSFILSVQVLDPLSVHPPSCLPYARPKIQLDCTKVTHRLPIQYHYPVNKKSLNGPIKLCFGTICKNSLNAL